MNIKVIMKKKNWLTKNKILNERRKRINVVNKKIRLLESELLDPEYAYMKIDNNAVLCLHLWKSSFISKYCHYRKLENMIAKTRSYYSI